MSVTRNFLAACAKGGFGCRKKAGCAHRITDGTPVAIHPAKSKRSDTMQALCWHGKGDVRVDTVPDPVIQEPRDIIVKMTSTAICGSDLHLLDGFVPTMTSGDVLDIAALGEAATTTRNPSGIERISAIVLAITGIDIVVALRIESDLNHARKVTQVARNRVRRTSAIPNASNGMRHSGGTPAVDVPRDIEVSIVEIVGS